MTPLDEFRRFLNRPDLPQRLASGLIGDDAVIDGPYGRKPLVYTDYVASGRALAQVESFVQQRILPYYANSHSQASHCGAFVTRLREAARAEIARITGADRAPPADPISVIFTGAGATAGLNRIVALLDIPARAAAGRVVVLTGPYEHHSNLLPWRESGAEVIEIPEGPGGGPDMAALAQALGQSAGADLIVGAFGAASNVTGILTDSDAVTRCLKAHGALAVWDYGCAGPYVPIHMRPGTDAAKDAIVFSSHKFPGGPGGSGVTLIRDGIVQRRTPSWPGGGTVSFVSPWEHVYSTRLSEREEGGTPNVLGDIRASLALMIKEALGEDWLAARQGALRARALVVWRNNPHLELLGLADAPALPIFSFRVQDGAGGLIHHQLFTRMLSDVHGIQARGGCACAGSYAHALLGIDRAASAKVRASLSHGAEAERPGWVRLNLSALMSDAKADFVIAGVDALARRAGALAADYREDTATARFSAIGTATCTAPQETGPADWERLPGTGDTPEGRAA